MQQAGFFPRLIAYLVDGFLIGIIVGLFNCIFGSLIGGAANVAQNTDSGLIGLMAGGLSLVLIAILFLLQFLYFGYFWSKSGQSIGMRLMNIKVLEREGGLLTFVKAGLRGSVGYWISGFIFGLGFLWAAFDAHKEAWHDKIFGTRVYVA